MNELIFEKQLEFIINSLPIETADLFIEIDKSLLHISCLSYDDKDKILENIHSISKDVYTKLGLGNINVWVHDQLICQLDLDEAYNLNTRDDYKHLTLVKCADIVGVSLEEFLKAIEDSSTQITVKNGCISISMNEFLNVVEYINDQYFEYCRDFFLEVVNEYESKVKTKKNIMPYIKSILKLFNK